MTKKFPIGDILTVTTGRVVARKGMEALYDLYKFMLNDEYINSSALMEMYHQVNQSICKQLPWITDIQVDPELMETEEGVFKWLTTIETQYGKMITLKPLVPSITGS